VSIELKLKKIGIVGLVEIRRRKEELRDS